MLIKGFKDFFVYKTRAWHIQKQDLQFGPRGVILHTVIITYLAITKKEENLMNTQEHERNIQEIWALFRETRESISAMSQESRERAREIDERFKEVSREFEKRSKETDERFKETNKQFKKTDKKINKLAGLFDSQWGKLMESLAEGGLLKLFQQRGIDVYQIYQRAKSRRNGQHMEMDLLLVNDDEVVVVEVKTILKADDVRDFLEDMAEFPEFFHHYRDSRIYGAVAGLRMEQKSDRFAQKQGLFVIKVGGDGMTEILNDSDFRAKDFGSG